jgi:hypothetical protein
MGSLNTHSMKTLRGTVLRISSPRIRNYADSDGKTGTGGNFRLSHALPWHIRTVQVITQQQKLYDSCNVPSDRFNVRFHLRHGSPARGHKPAGDAHHFIFFHLRPANLQPTITGVNLCHRNVGRPRFTETRVIRHQPFLLVHNAQLHSECYTMTKAATKHVKITSFPLPTYSTLTFTYVIKYDRRPHSDTDRTK